MTAKSESSIFPGIYSLDASSLDEKITRDYLLSRDADLIVNVIDASNLERNLYFSVQLREMGVPILVALNMMDVARKRGMEVDTEILFRAAWLPRCSCCRRHRRGDGSAKTADPATALGTEKQQFPSHP